MIEVLTYFSTDLHFSLNISHPKFNPVDQLLTNFQLLTHFLSETTEAKAATWTPSGSVVRAQG